LATRNHASETLEYGGATDVLYGHVKLLDKENNDYDSSNSVAVTPKALYNLKSASILKGDVLTKDNIESISGALISGTIDLGSNIPIPEEILDSFNGDNPIIYIRAPYFVGTTTNANYAVKAERDIYDRNIHEYYVLKEEHKEDLENFDTIKRDGVSTTISSILNVNNANNSFLYQNNYKGYMPAINLATSDGRIGFGSDEKSCLITYVKNGNTTNIPDSSLKLTSTSVNVSGDLYINSDKNSVVCKNDGSKFQLLVTNSVDGTPNTTYIPLQFDLATTKNEYNNETVAGKMTIGGDLHTLGTITAKGKVYNAVWNDYAEFFEKGEETEVGDIIALDLSSDEERYVKASKENPTVVGVHSDTYGHILGGEGTLEECQKTHIPVGLVGRVKTKIVGKIKKGEHVVLSDIQGVGKAYCSDINNPLDIIGVAIESSDDEDVKLIKIKLK
jgi:hypothetical protein